MGALGAFKTSHFEEVRIRQIGSRGCPFLWSRVMSNLLKVAMIDRVFSLHRQGLSQRQIARRLGINRETVARYLRQAEDASKPAIAPPGSVTAEPEPKPAIAPPGSVTAEPEPEPPLRPRLGHCRAGAKTSHCALRLCFPFSRVTRCMPPRSSKRLRALA